ncbi:MAG: methyltransferase domain-containing protein [bacterium]|nr:methyltransferase domain-containing protein [bacterium]
MESNMLWRDMLKAKDKALISCYVYWPGGTTENRFYYQNESAQAEEAVVLLFGLNGDLALPAFVRKLLPAESLDLAVGAHLTAAGYSSFEGSFLLMVKPLGNPTAFCVGDKDITAIWESKTTSCHITNSGYSEFNIPGKKEKQSYFMFCPAVLLNDTVKTRLVVINHSSDPAYNDTVAVSTQLCNLAGDVLNGPQIIIPPFGTSVVDVDSYFGSAGKALLDATGGRGSFTSTHKGHILISFFFEIDRHNLQVVSGRHTQPPMGILGAVHFRYLFNWFAERIPGLGFLYIIKNILKRVRFYFHIFYPQKPAYISNLWQYFKQSRFTVYIIFVTRAIYFCVAKGFRFDILEVTDKNNINANAIYHNLWENLNVFSFGRGRIESLLWPLKCIPSLKLDGKTLCIGPRSEGELLLLGAHGFKFANITGIDLFSYSPKIRVMDIQDMKFPDNTFDTIFCGWVLKYCYDINKAVAEIIRVAKDGALITCGFTYVKEEEEAPIFGDVYLRGGVTELLNYFGSAVGPVYFRFEDLVDGKGKMRVVFRIKKNNVSTLMV